MRSLPGTLAFVGLLGLTLLCTTAHAQPAEPAAAPPASTLSEEEIQKALSTDASGNRKSGASQEVVVPNPTAPSAAGLLGQMPRFFQSLNPDMSFIADFALAYFSPYGMGITAAGARQANMPGGHDPTENGFNLQALELAVGATVDPYFRFDANIVYLQGGVEIEEAYGTTLALPAGLQVRAGKFLTRFGRFNATHPHTWNFADDPLVLARFFGGDGNRGLGMEVSELVGFLPWYVELVLSATDAREAARSFWGSPPNGAAFKVHSPADLEYTGAVKQFFPLSDDLSLSWGLSGAFAPNWSGGRTEIYGTDLYLKYRPVGQAAPPIVSLHAELLMRRYHALGTTWTDSGAFAQVLYRFAPRWAVAGGAEYVTSAQNNPVDPGLFGTTLRYKADLTFYPTEFSRLRVQYDLEPPGPAHGVTAHAVFLAAEFAVGAHGAHQF